MKYLHPTSIKRSDTFANLEWQGQPVAVKTFGKRGDTYPTTWGADGELYSAAGDPCWTEFNGEIINKPEQCPEFFELIYRKVSGTAVEKLTGNGKNFDISRINDMPGLTGWGGNGPKPTGMVSVNGVLYLAVQNLLGYKPPRYGAVSQHGSDASVFASYDLGKTWTPNVFNSLYEFYKNEYSIGGISHLSWKTNYLDRNCVGDFKPMFRGNLFGGPSFIQFGKDNCDAVDDFVYAVSGDQWDNGSEFRLGRVPKDCILQREKWEFAITNDSGDIFWTPHLDISTPILSIERHLGAPEMVYIKEHKKYLLLTWSLHKEFRACDGSQLTVLESDNPWGPFRLVHYEWMWDTEAVCPYCPRIPLKWFDGETLTGHMLYSGSWENQQKNYWPRTRAFKLILKENRPL